MATDAITTKYVPLTPDGLPYEGIAVVVKARAMAGDLDYVRLWSSRSCFWCGAVVDPTMVGQHRGRTFDHLVTRADRGGDEAGNLRNCCCLCNHVRDRRDPADFRKLADLVIRPNREDLPGLGHALLSWGLVTEARVAWSFAGMPRRAANALIHARLGDDAFDPSTKKGFEDLVSVLLDGHALQCAAMPDADLLAAVAAAPSWTDLRRARSASTADAAARRDAAIREANARGLPWVASTKA